MVQVGDVAVALAIEVVALCPILTRTLRTFRLAPGNPGSLTVTARPIPHLRLVFLRQVATNTQPSYSRRIPKGCDKKPWALGDEACAIGTEVS